jgi:hypothetical protein
MADRQGAGVPRQVAERVRLAIGRRRSALRPWMVVVRAEIPCRESGKE